MKYYIDQDGKLIVNETETVRDDLIEISEYQAAEFSKYAVSHTCSLSDGKLLWVEKVVEKTVIDQISDLENSITARRYREAFLGDEESQAFIKDVNDQIELLREEL